MAERNKENLRELLEKFLGSKHASGALEDIQIGEHLLRENSAPEPSVELKEQIKERIGETLEKRRIYEAPAKQRLIVYRRLLYKPVAAAAAIILLFGLSIMMHKERPPERVPVIISMIPASVWVGDDITADDVELSILAAEIAQIEDEILSVQSDYIYGNGTDALMELEQELIEIDSEFWKG